jgi:4-amino-4-deoxy-L-arabinose transferase-like glycosyltransferase
MEQPDTPARIAKTELVLFVATVVLYTALAFICHSDQLIWDEPRYLDCARELSKGHLASENNTDFINGPGYPVVLWPFVAAKVSLIWPRILNALFIAVSGVLLHRTVRHYAGMRWATAAALMVVLHPNLLRLGPYLMTEPLTLFCVCAFIWAFTSALRAPCHSWRWIAAASFAFAYLIMTRVIFGHVVLVMLIGALGAMLFFKSIRTALARTALISALTFALCIPYLAYTKANTGQNLCWSTNGGELLYWMTSHNPGENGHWFSYDDATTLPELAPNHKEFIVRVNKLTVPEREAEFAKAAREHFQSSPAAVARNWVCNVSRLFFGFPRSFRAEEVIILPIILFNAPLLFLLAAAVLVAARRPRSVPPEIAILFIFALIYFGGSTLASGLPRYFLIITPPLWLFVSTVLHRNVRVSLERMHL